MHPLTCIEPAGGVSVNIVGKIIEDKVLYIYRNSTQQKQTNNLSAKADSFSAQRTWAIQTYHIPLTKAGPHWLLLVLYEAKSNKAKGRANLLQLVGIMSLFHTLLLSHKLYINFCKSFISKPTTKLFCKYLTNCSVRSCIYK